MENGREDRVKKELPVTVSGEDAQGNPFRLNTYTLDLSPHGAHVGRLPPLKGTDDTLEIQHQGKRARYRVIWVGEPGTRLEGHAGLRCEDEQPPEWALPQQFAVEWPGSLTGGAPAASSTRASSHYRWPAVIVLALAVILVGSYLARRERVAEPAPPTPPAAQPAEQLPGEALTPMPPLAPQPEQPPAPATGPVEPMTSSGAPAFAVQVGAFENRQTAEVLARRLNATYQHDVVVSPLQTRGAMVYRVRIPVATEAEARELARRLSAEQSLQTLIVPLPPE